MRRVLHATLLTTAIACAPSDPVRWDQATERASPSALPSALTMDSPSAIPALTALHDLCPGSVRQVARGSERFAVAWRAEPSRAAQLVFTRSVDGGATWSAPAVVDGRDTGARGCDRPAPAIALGDASDYVHLVYWIEPTNGPGVFFSHSMDAGGMFHAPVAAAYGGRPAAAAVASLGDTVVVVHEDPNSPRPRLRIALSKTAGHIFEHREALPATSTPQLEPRVAVRPGSLLVGWREAPGASTLVVRRASLRFE